MQGCFALMLGFDNPPSFSWTAAHIDKKPVAWAAINSSKPGRSSKTSVIIHSSNKWADDNMETDPKEVEGFLIASASESLGFDFSIADYVSLHRWRYAATTRPANEDFLIDEQNQLAACGDWCLGSRVEPAFLSATRLGHALTAKL